MTVDELRAEYVGREVVVKTEQVIIGGETYPTYSCEDPLLEELTEKIESLGLSSRIFLPDTMGDCGYNTSRANVMVAQKPESDKFIIANIGIG